MTNANGLVLKVATYGAIVTEFTGPDKRRPSSATSCSVSITSTATGRATRTSARRSARRESHSRRQVQARRKDYKLAAKHGQHHLHGGVKGWDKVVLVGRVVRNPDGPALKLTYVSTRRRRGYPAR